MLLSSEKKIIMCTIKSKVGKNKIKNKEKKKRNLLYILQSLHFLELVYCCVYGTPRMVQTICDCTVCVCVLNTSFTGDNAQSKKRKTEISKKNKNGSKMLVG